LEASQGAANAKPGPRSAPARVFPVPRDISPAAQTLVAAPYRVPAWNANPSSAEGWRALVRKLADASLPSLAKGREALGVTTEPTVIGGVKGFVFTPKIISNTVRTQRKLRDAGVEAELQVFEGFSHAQYLFDPTAPETKTAFTEIAAFFGKHLAP